MIDMHNFKEVQVFEPEAVVLFSERDFLDFAGAEENKRYLFVVKQYHPIEDGKVIAHECYVFDVTSRQWFSYHDILLSKEEYAKLHEGDDEDSGQLLDDSEKDRKEKIEFLKKYISEHGKKELPWHIDMVDLVRYSRTKEIPCPFTEANNWEVSRLLQNEPELADMVRAAEEEQEKETLRLVEEVSVIISGLAAFKQAKTVGMKKMIIKKYLLENGHGKIATPSNIVNIKDLADIKEV